jgi:hypothetical protein
VNIGMLERRCTVFSQDQPHAEHRDRWQCRFRQ